ncbi:hypothetical protein G9A89_007066 [Geosiphon pyriformis]|nr:hypothetical protein G9A89_007066 [Geosiphon pyriformis]
MLAKQACLFRPKGHNISRFFSTHTPLYQYLFAWGTLPSFSGEPSQQTVSTVPKLLDLGHLISTDLTTEEKKSLKITQLAAGWAHSLIAFKYGKGLEKTGIFSMGLNTSGQLGLGKISKNGFQKGIIKTLPNDKEVRALACGRLHSFVLLSGNDGKKEVYGFGDNMYGQLGLDKNKDYVGFENEFQLNNVCEPLPCGLNIPAPSDHVRQITCGLDHTILLTEQNALYSMGWGSDGQLGLGGNSTSDKSIPTLITGLKGELVRKIASTTDFTMALLENGDLWTWGNSEYGQCISGAKVDRILEPWRIQTGHRVVDVAGGGPFSLFLDDQGDVFVCGYGALGLGEGVIEKLTPTRIPQLSNILAIYCGTDYAAAISESKDLYTWGLGGPSGRLGLCHLNNQYMPSIVKFPEKVNIVTIACGSYHVLALCN